MHNPPRPFSNNDLYTYTVKRVVWERFPEAWVEYAFKNRDGDVDLRPCMETIRRKLAELDGATPSERTLATLRQLGTFPEGFLHALSQFRMDTSLVQVGERHGKLDIRIEGPWYQTIDLEVPVLQIVSESFYEAFDREEARAEGDRRLTEKIERIRRFVRDEIDAVGGPPLCIVDMGTRRAYSMEWHGHVLRRLREELPEAFLGTSNVYWGEELGLRLYGTFSHQGPMAMQAYVPIQDSQHRWLEIWLEVFEGQLAVALSDTLRTNMFLRDFDRTLARAYDGARQDSGDPLEWGERFIAHLESLGIDPTTKTAVFSDSLNDQRVTEIYRRFAGRVGMQFGIGTFLTNDVGLRSLSNVIKMVRCNGYPVAKLSDSAGKAQSDDPEYLRYVTHLVNKIVPEADRRCSNPAARP